VRRRGRLYQRVVSVSADGVASCCFHELKKGSYFFEVEVRLGEDQVDDEAVQAVDGGLGSAATRNGDFGIQNSPDVKELRFGEVGECNAVALNFGILGPKTGFF